MATVLRLWTAGSGERTIGVPSRHAPDLVAEVTSPTGRGRDLIDKPDVYCEIGVPEYWVVDLAHERVVVHRRDADGVYHTTERTSGTLTTEHAPGLEVPVAELFATG